jgi:single-strand DNA-binding protein
MATSLNLCQFIGHLGRDPETRYMPSGEQVTNFSIAVSRSWKSKDGEKKEETEWVRITAFGKLAEIVSKYLHKGSLVYVAGRAKTSKYDKDGITHYQTGYIAETMQMLDGKDSKGDSAGDYEHRSQKSTTNKYDDDLSDIPF